MRLFLYLCTGVEIHLSRETVFHFEVPPFPRCSSSCFVFHPFLLRLTLAWLVNHLTNQACVITPPVSNPSHRILPKCVIAKTIARTFLFENAYQLEKKKVFQKESRLFEYQQFMNLYEVFLQNVLLCILPKKKKKMIDSLEIGKFL